jgi:hypothetical protein
MSGKPVGKVAMTATQRQRRWRKNVKRKARAAKQQQRRQAAEQRRIARATKTAAGSIPGQTQ